MRDFHAIVAALDELSHDRDAITSIIHQMRATLDSAAGALGQLDDPNASEAERSIRAANSELREILASWFVEYATRSADLRQRLTS